jgi:hypothetical protein
MIVGNLRNKYKDFKATIIKGQGSQISDNRIENKYASRLNCAISMPKNAETASSFVNKTELDVGVESKSHYCEHADG